MRDKDARKRLLLLQARVDRLEAAFEQIQYATSNTMNQELNGNIQCGQCNFVLYDNYVCGDNNCPHGLDADTDEAE